MRRLCAIMAIVLTASLKTFAYSLVVTDNYDLGPDDRLDGQALIVAGTSVVAGAVSDDLFVIAGEASLGGLFGNDVWALSPTVDLHGNVADHLRAAGAAVTISGQIGNGLSAAAMTLSIHTNAQIRGGVLAAAETFTTAGNIEGNVKVYARQVTLGGTVIGNVTLHGDDLVVMPGTVISGDLLYATTNRDLILDSRVTVGGELERISTEEAPTVTRSYLPWLLSRLYFLVAALMVSIPVVLLFPRTMANAVLRVRAGPLKCGLIGGLTMLAVPIMITMCLVSVIGIPLAAVLLAGGGLLAYLAKIPGAIVIGGLILRKSPPLQSFQSLMALVAGLIIFYILSAIPMVGQSLQLVVVMIGGGGLIMSLYEAGRVPRQVEGPSSQQQDNA